MTPTTKKEYELLKPAVGKQLNAVLILATDATWHIVRTEFSAHAPLAVNQTEVWHGWEEMMQRTTEKHARILHERLFGFPWPKKDTYMSLVILLWNYRCKHAIDHTVDEGQASVTAGNPLQRHSSIAGRTYQVITPSMDAKAYTSPAAMACLKIIDDVCKANGGTCTEEQLKKVVLERGAEITPKVESAWRFLQFYRPLLVNAERIIYKK